MDDNHCSECSCFRDEDPRAGNYAAEVCVYDSFTRLRQDAPRLAAGRNGEATRRSLGEVGFLATASFACFPKDAPWLATGSFTCEWDPCSSPDAEGIIDAASPSGSSWCHGAEFSVEYEEDTLMIPVE